MARKKKVTIEEKPEFHDDESEESEVEEVPVKKTKKKKKKPKPVVSSDSESEEEKAEPVKKSKKKAKKKAAGPKKPNAWLAHVKEVRAKNPDLSYKAALKEASKSYKKANAAVVTDV